MSFASRQLIEKFDLTRVSAPLFFRSADDIERFAGKHPYSHLMRRAWETMHLNGILCVDGRPTVYFKEVKRLDSIRQHNRYRKFWNQGLATLLVVSSPDQVQVFSSLAKPVKEDSQVDNEGRLVEILDSTTKVLNFVKRVQSGQIYRDKPQCFDSNQTVDKFLLRNLSEARDQLHQHNNLSYKVVHALLGRVIFACYLIERGIIDESLFAEANAKGIKSLHELLTQYDNTKAKKILYDLFAVLQRHFNGSMFDDTVEKERPQIDDKHISILRRFLIGEELKSKQSTFDFWAYDFSVIPIETISSIYEEFLGAEDKAGKRKSGAYYTPKHLAEMVVDVATSEWNSLLDKRILDPACGSGIFLVIIFNRIAEQWRYKNPGVHNITRAEALLEIIREKICGIDVNETACRIACFSLYLAFLDQLKPREIYELEAKRGKILDNFLALKDSAYSNNESPVIFEGDFFENTIPAAKNFDLVIGNPPWVSRGRASDAKALDWCLSEDNNPYLDDAPRAKADRKKYFLPARQIAHAFMWKSSVHLNDNGKACLVLSTKVLFNNSTDKFQAGWFSNVTVEKVVQLSDWRHILFENAVSPSVIVKYNARKPKDDYSIDYEVPKVSSCDPRRGVIHISPEDQKTIRLFDIQQYAKKNKISIAWKEKFWGTRRDNLLLDRLLEMPCLGELVSKPKEKTNLFIASQGFQPFNEERYSEGKKAYGEPQPAWWTPEQLYIDAKKIGPNLIITKKNCEKVGPRFKKLHRIRDKRIYTRPKVLVNKGFTKAVYCDFEAIFQDAIYSISGSPSNYRLLMFIAAVLNSKLAKYFQFHTSANLGIEREQIFPTEYKRIPFPLPKDTENPEESDRIINEIAMHMSDLKALIEKDFMLQEEKVALAAEKIEVLLYKYYGISQHEQLLIDDTVNIFKSSMMPTSINSRVKTIGCPTPNERKGYAELLCSILNTWAKRSDFHVNGRVEYSEILGTSIVTLVKSHKTERYSETKTSDDLHAALKNIQNALPKKMGKFVYHRHLKVFDGNQLYILKPLSRRYWTKTAAINDADEIAVAILSSEGSR